VNRTRHRQEASRTTSTRSSPSPTAPQRPPGSATRPERPEAADLLSPCGGSPSVATPGFEMGVSRDARMLTLPLPSGTRRPSHADETLAADDLEQPRWKRPRCLLCPAIASVSADRIDAPESSRAVISAWLLDCRRTDSLGSLVRGSGGPTRPVCGRWLGLRGSRQGHILRGSSARQSEYLTVRKPRPRRRVVSHERGGVCEACSVWRWWSCFWRLAGK